MRENLTPEEARKIFEQLQSLMGKNVDFDYHGHGMSGKLINVEIQMEYIRTKIEVMVDYGMAMEIGPGTVIKEVPEEEEG